MVCSGSGVTSNPAIAAARTPAKLGLVVLRHRRIKVQLTAFNQLHNRNIGKELGNRPHPIDRFSGCRRILLGISKTKTLRPDDLLIINQRNCESGRVLLRDLVFGQPLQLSCRLDISFLCRNRRLAVGNLETRKQDEGN
jgi:hypothetical protein